jgi:signal transduction histidine kinase
VEVAIDGAVLGTITLSVPKGRHLRAAEEQLLSDLADQAALAFRNVAMEAQLAAHVAELDQTTRRLGDSRARIIEADDAAREALEAAITREVLPLLVGLPAQLQEVREGAANGMSRDVLDRLVAQTNTSLEALRELTRGVFPTQLARAGIAPAVRSHLARLGMDGILEVGESAAGRRFPARVEAAVYFCADEAARSATRPRAMRLSVDDETLVLRVSGASGLDVDLNAVIDRVEAAGGTVEADAEPGLTIRIPVGSPLSP